MVLHSAGEEGETASNKAGRGESRLTALARDLVDTVGADGAARYCNSLGWRGVLREVEQLRRQRAQVEQPKRPAA